jgi:hypothetical protein
MLFWLSSATIMGSAGASFADGMPAGAGGTAVTPQDPSTLVLAAIGLATVAVYLAMRRRPARIEQAPSAGSAGEELHSAESIGVERQRSRGAA